MSQAGGNQHRHLALGCLFDGCRHKKSIARPVRRRVGHVGLTTGNEPRPARPLELLLIARTTRIVDFSQHDFISWRQFLRDGYPFGGGSLSHATASHKNLRCVGALSTRGRSARLHEPPPRVPMMR